MNSHFSLGTKMRYFFKFISRDYFYFLGKPCVTKDAIKLLNNLALPNSCKCLNLSSL